MSSLRFARIRPVIALAACLSIATGTWFAAAPAAQAAVNGACITASDSFLSVNVAPEFDWPVGIPSGYRRIWDMRATWQDVNPAPGTWNWSTLAYRISQIRASGSRVLYVMGMTPAWAAADPSAGDLRWGLGTSSAPANMDTWREYVDRLVSEFGGSIDAYELWNEANLKTFWTGSVTDLAHMTRIAYDVIQAKDPSALLLAPSITTRLTSSGENFTRAFVPALLAEGLPVEGWSIHSYPDGDADPGERVRDVRYFQAVMADLLATRPEGLNLPLWDTEVNYGVKGPANIPGRAFSPEEGARLMASTFADSQALGIDATFWYLYTVHPNDIVGVQFTPDTPLTQAAWFAAAAAHAPGTRCIAGAQTSDPGTKADAVPVAYSIAVSARRAPGNAIMVTGKTNLPEGLVLQPFVKTEFDRAFRMVGPRIVVAADGSFTWQARTGRAAKFIFTSEAGTTKSNVLSVAARR